MTPGSAAGLDGGGPAASVNKPPCAPAAGGKSPGATELTIATSRIPASALRPGSPLVIDRSLIEAPSSQSDALEELEYCCTVLAEDPYVGRPDQCPVRRRLTNVGEWIVSCGS